MNMTQEEIENELDNMSFSSAEVEHFHHCLREHDYAGAHKILIEQTEPHKAQAIINYFQTKNAQPYELVPISVKNIPREESEQYYLFKYGPMLSQSMVYFLQNRYGFFSHERNFVDLDKAQQAWIVKAI